MSIELNSMNPNRQESVRRDDKIGSQNSLPAESLATDTAESEISGASLSLSATAQSLNQLEASLKQTSDVDIEKVEEIRSQLQNNEYRIDSTNLAQKMLDLDI
jgi:flagellar biosynthesis anti-sigma factor FlgM